jgi:hypothetical protein
VEKYATYKLKLVLMIDWSRLEDYLCNSLEAVIQSGSNNNSDEIIVETSLQSFFFDQMDRINKCSVNPFPQETIYYSSRVMDRLNDPTCLFKQSQDGRLENRVLGLQLLEAGKMKSRQQQRALQEVGESALMLCGFFHQSLEQKLVDLKYYQELGAVAYLRLNRIVPELFEVPSFYQSIALSFKVLSDMMTVVAQDFFNSKEGAPVLLVVNGQGKLPKAS